MPEVVVVSRVAHCLRLVCRRALGVVLLAAGGAALLPLSRELHRAEAAAELQEGLPALTPGQGDALVEQLAFFALGGLRSLAAEILVLDATNAWIERDWARVERRWQLITTLSPGRPNYWLNASRDMAVNAAGHAAGDAELDAQERVLLARAYVDRGERFLRDGIAHLPDSALLFMNLGDLYSNQNRSPRFALAAAAYHRAVELGASPLYRRQEFYSLCRIRGREQEAWRLGRALYESSSQRVPSLLCLLFVLQQRIEVPEAERLSPEQLFGSEEKARRELRRFANNSLLFPVDGIRRYLSAGE
ncbi:MAG: hypothetical protein J1E42_06465 [Akkermansiaceae bacterium]|nr:hypothetical protein [Akkermansiaceae bacterium]